MQARIYKPSKTTMQSGRARRGYWVLEYEPETPRKPEPLMGWTQAEDTLNQVSIKFETMEAAKAFAQKNNLSYTVLSPHDRRVRPRNYGDNFRYVQPEEKS